MVITTIKTSDCTPQTIVIGRRATYDTLQVVFDLSFLAETYGSGAAVLVVKRSQDETAYPATVAQDGNTLTWTVSETDTYYVGSGECELMWYVNNGLAKTIIYPVVVLRDMLQTTEEPPDAYENWVEHLTALGAETQQNAQNAAQSASDAETAKDVAVTAKEAAKAAQEAAETAVTHYPTIQNNYWMVWDSATRQYVSTGIQAEGEDGYSPEVTIESITGGHRVTITDKDHPQGQSFDVMDGQGGGTSDYTDLTNKPSINNVTLTGNKTAADLGLATPSDIPTNAGDIEFDDQETYAAGSVGAEVSAQKNAISENAISAFDSFMSIGVQISPTAEHILPYKGLSGADVINSATTCLIYDVTVSSGWKIHFTDYSGYKYYLKYWKSSNSTWADYKSVYYTSDYLFTETVRISVYVRNTAGTNLTDADISAIKARFKLVNTNADLLDTVSKVPKISEQVGNTFFDSTKFVFGKVLNANGTLTDNGKTILIYPFDALVGDTIGLKSYSVYKFCYKAFSSGSWGSATTWQTSDLIMDQAKTLCFYIRRIDDADVTETDLATLQNIAFYSRSASVISRLGALEEAENDSNSSGVSFENVFVPSSLLELPNDFSDFPIPVKISRNNGAYGYNVKPINYIKNNSQGATYYVAKDGSNSNAGTTPDVPLATITAALSKADINTLVINTGEYVNGVDFDNTAIASSINIIGNGKVVLKSASAQNPMKFSAGCYVENIVFDGGISACDTQLSTDLMVFNKCKFLNSGSENGLSAKGGYYVLFDCEASNNNLDGFNYHSNGGNKPKALEIRCYGTLNGHRSSQNINNGSTMHESGGQIIRIGCVFSACRGGVIADADGAKSVNICVRASSTEAVDVEDRNANFLIIGSSSTMWLYDCASYGSPYDLIADGGTIYATDTYPKESTANDGTITRLEN